MTDAFGPSRMIVCSASDAAWSKTGSFARSRISIIRSELSISSRTIWLILYHRLSPYSSIAGDVSRGADAKSVRSSIDWNSTALRAFLRMQTYILIFHAWSSR